MRTLENVNGIHNYVAEPAHLIGMDLESFRTILNTISARIEMAEIDDHEMFFEYFESDGHTEAVIKAVYYALETTGCHVYYGRNVDSWIIGVAL